MEPEGSLPHSQVPTTCPYPEPARSTSHFLQIHHNIILPSMPGSPKWSLTLRFPHQIPIYASTLRHTRYISRPSHSSRFNHPNFSTHSVLLLVLSCLVCNCCWLTVCIVAVVLCVLLSYVYLLYYVGIAVFLLYMPDCWLEVSIRKVLRPATSTQVFLGFLVPKSKC